MTFAPTAVDQLPPVVLHCAACGGSRVFPVGINPHFALHTIARWPGTARFPPQMTEAKWFHNVEHRKCAK